MTINRTTIDKIRAATGEEAHEALQYHVSDLLHEIYQGGRYQQ